MFKPFIKLTITLLGLSLVVACTPANLSSEPLEVNEGSRSLGTVYNDLQLLHLGPHPRANRNTWPC